MAYFSKQNNLKGFSLIEIIFSITVFVLFVLGIYGGVQLVFKIVYQSRITIIESGILNGQMEIIRNMAFENVGIVNGSPPGLLPRSVTTTLNNIEFEITRTIRNIDDPFDGLAGGEPNDESPADYKLVYIEVICARCGQREPKSAQTYVSPKYLEGNPDHGALFVRVFDANALAVQGARVHVVATSTDTPIDLVDTTDNEGMLRLVDLGSGLQSYDITVSKDGYTVDQTARASETVLNPVKPPVSVMAQDVSEVSFEIDRVSSINVSTIDAMCQPVGGARFNMRGTKLLGADPDVLKVNQNVESGSSGLYDFSSLEWDAYAVSVSGYDLIGSIPGVPLTLLPGANQPLQLILGVDSENSLLINARNSVNGQPLSNASVEISSDDGYNVAKITGVGSIRQTDWSGGAGQMNMVEQYKYWSDDGGVEVDGSAGNVTLLKVGENYVASGELESSTFDLGAEVNYVNLVWEPLSQPENTDLKFQIATSDSSSIDTWTYLGPDGTPDTYYTSADNSINSIHNGDRYFRYKVFLSTDVADSTPILSDLSLTFTNKCTPPGQVYAQLLSGEYDVEILLEGFQPYNTSVEVDGDVFLTADLVSL